MQGDKSLLVMAQMLAVSVAMQIFEFLDWEEGQRAAAAPFHIDARGQSGARTAVNLVVSILVGGLLAAFLIPIAVDEILGVDTSSWTNGAGALWGILPTMIVLSVFLFFVGEALAGNF